MTKRSEIKEGVNGSGRTIWIVFTCLYNDRGEVFRVLGMERFETLAEAESWLKWAC